jgi:hypothetical protein
LMYVSTFWLAETSRISVANLDCDSAILVHREIHGIEVVFISCLF